MSEAHTPSTRFTALQHRDFVLIWAGQGVSLIGTQIQRVAVAWQIYLLTHSPVSLGLIGLCRVGPVIVLALGTGALADAIDRRRLMIWTQSALALTSVGLCVLTATDHASVAAVYGFTLLAGCATAFDNPARNALVPNLVPREHLASALSLNITVWQVAAVVGPGIGGLLLGLRGGIALVYALDAASFLAVIGALLAMRHRPAPVVGQEVSWRAIGDGLRFLRGQPVILGMMLLDFLGTFLAGATLLMPIFADTVLHVGARGLGVLLAAPSVGAVGAALVLSSMPEIRARGKAVLLSVVIYGVSIAVFGLSRIFALSLFCLAISGAADTISTVVRQTVRQMLTPDALRGRMTSVNMIFFMGGPQLGEVEAGLVAGWIGAPLSVATGGLGCAILAVIIAAAFPKLRMHRAGDA